MVTSTLFFNAKQIVTNSSGKLYEIDLIEDASLFIENGKVAWVGKNSNAPAADKTIDCTNKVIIPGFVDSHTHLIFGGDRSDEFAARMAGESYTAGGINFTVEKTRSASDQELRVNASSLIAEMHSTGTTSFEIKSGYGLTLQDEIRLLKLAKEFTQDVTLMAAHVVPKEYIDNRRGYIELIIKEMLPAAQGIAKFVDVFCETGAFSVEEAREILLSAKDLGFECKVHSNQLSRSESVQLARDLGAVSVDHVTYFNDKDLENLRESGIVATLLPATEFSTNSPYPDAKKLIDAGVTLAIATNCNPGSSFTTSMPFCIAIAVREMNFNIEQALWAATRGGALALGNKAGGNLAVGANADFAILDAPSYVHLAYRPGVNLVYATYKNGEVVFSKGGK
jgi:imidazolonepropionase